LTRKKGLHEEGESEVRKLRKLRKLRFFPERRLKIERALMPKVILIPDSAKAKVTVIFMTNLHA
jgi:hypothetical protein